MKRDIAILAAVGLLSVLAGILVFRFTQPEPTFASATGTQPGATLSYQSLNFNDVGGKRYHLSAWGKPIQIINFWAPWCAPCRREIPALIQTQQAYDNKVQIIGLAFDNAQNVKAFSAGFEFNYPLLLVGANSAAVNHFFGNQSGGLPFTVILDQQRNIVFQHAGEISAHQLDQQIQALIAALT